MGGRWAYIVAKDLASKSYGSHRMTDMSMTLNTNIKGLKRSEHIEERMLRKLKTKGEEKIRLV